MKVTEHSDPLSSLQPLWGQVEATPSCCLQVAAVNIVHFIQPLLVFSLNNY